MIQVFYKIIKLIDTIILWFYQPFKKLIPEQTFKYAATGGANTTLDIILYYIFYNFVLHKEILDLGFYAISPHIAAFMMAFTITFPTGFLLAKFISFPGSYLRKRIQLLRYGLTVTGNILLNYFCLKLFVEIFEWQATFSKIIATFLSIIFSYTVQKYFTFRIEKK